MQIKYTSQGMARMIRILNHVVCVNAGAVPLIEKINDSTPSEMIKQKVAGACTSTAQILD